MWQLGQGDNALQNTLGRDTSFFTLIDKKAIVLLRHPVRKQAFFCVRPTYLVLILCMPTEGTWGIWLSNLLYRTSIDVVVVLWVVVWTSDDPGLDRKFKTVLSKFQSNLKTFYEIIAKLLVLFCLNDI